MGNNIANNINNIVTNIDNTSNNIDNAVIIGTLLPKLTL
ncbi:hypothetical protein J3E07_000925 [Methanococcus voltae]|jgi:hypothetical protein|uniref:Uncharacterized protein n=2 Tax=Methanococcus voltae TaxID=2188 RepID=A0A8J7S522_METVO|nr:hypothetical protein [Methanococcus voltae]MBP2201513.1 hypothetical protein [Methanococcus voltae]MCS3922302.1 hypothetical protein [Methanococcus voltae PS]